MGSITVGIEKIRKQRYMISTTSRVTSEAEPEFTESIAKTDYTINHEMNTKILNEAPYFDDRTPNTHHPDRRNMNNQPPHKIIRE